MRIAAMMLCIAMLLGGCGYTLQGRANLPFDSIAIGTIKNDSVEPKLQDRLHRQLAEAFLRYGFEVRASAPHRIEGSILRFEMIPISEKALVAVEYQIRVISSFTLTDVRTGKVEDLTNVSGPFNTYFRSTDRLESVLAQKELASESAIRDLAEEIVRRIIYSKARQNAAVPVVNQPPVSATSPK